MASLDSHDLSARLVRTVVGFWSLGGVTVQQDHFQEVSHPRVPEHPLGNFVHSVRHDAGAALQALVGDEGTPQRRPTATSSSMTEPLPDWRRY